MLGVSSGVAALDPESDGDECCANVQKPSRQRSWSSLRFASFNFNVLIVITKQTMDQELRKKGPDHGAGISEQCTSAHQEGSTHHTKDRAANGTHVGTRKLWLLFWGNSQQAPQLIILQQGLVNDARVAPVALTARLHFKARSVGNVEAR